MSLTNQSLEFVYVILNSLHFQVQPDECIYY